MTTDAIRTTDSYDHIGRDYRQHVEDVELAIKYAELCRVNIQHLVQLFGLPARLLTDQRNGN